MTPNGGDPIIGSTEAARILGIHPATVTRWVISGELRAEDKLPGASGPYLFRRSVVEAKKASLQAGTTA